MANDYRDRSRRGGWRDEENRGMFGYEGEGYLRGGGRDVEDDLDRERESGARGYDRTESFGYGSPRGGSRGGGYSTEFSGGGYGTSRGGYDRDMGVRGGYGDFNRGDYASGGGGINTGRDREETGSYSGMAGGSIGGRWGRAESDQAGQQRQSFRGRGPKNYQRSDERIREDVCERLSMDDYVDASDIEVDVAGCVVTLTGSVNDRGAKRRAEDIAESVTGVKEVQNQIRLARGGDSVGNG